MIMFKCQIWQGEQGHDKNDHDDKKNLHTHEFINKTSKIVNNRGPILAVYCV